MFRFITKIVFICALTAVVYWLLQFVGKDAVAYRGALTALFTAPLWARLFGPYLVELIPAIRAQARRDACAPLNGRFYSYDNQPLRLFLVNGVIWIPAADLKPLLLPAPDATELRQLGAGHGTIPGQKLRGFSEHALLRLLTARARSRHASFATNRFGHWLQSEAFPNVRRLPSSSA
ncbi:MAG: hypothetical protein V4633_18325 [Pseudomonadota bacterium]